VGTSSPGGSWDSDDRFADLPPIDVEIPDDARELDEDVRRYRLEQRAAREPGPLRPQPAMRRWTGYGISGPLLIALLLVVALAGAVTSLLNPREPPPRTATPLATRATAAPGRPGALLPTGRVRIAGVAVELRGLRPAVFALLPPACACERELDELFARSRQYRLEPLFVAAGGGDAKQFRDLVARVGNGSAQPAEDIDGALRRAYEPRGLTIVLVRADGVVSAVHRGLPELPRLQLDLARLPHPPAVR
jgi:hypothetical protein